MDDLLQLALALDVPPTALMTPALDPHDDREKNWSLLNPEKDDVFKVSIDEAAADWRSDIAYSAHSVRQWIAGARPLLNRLDYQNDGDAIAGQRYYLRALPPSELRQAADETNRLRRAWRPVEELLGEESVDGE